MTSGAWIGDPQWRRNAAFGEEAVAMIKQVDPSRCSAGSPPRDRAQAGNATGR
jgi:hypothetical protein